MLFEMLFLTLYAACVLETGVLWGIALWAIRQACQKRKAEMPFRTTNAILLESGDKLLCDAICVRHKSGWTIQQIASYYNIYHNPTNANPGNIPDPLIALCSEQKGQSL